MVFQKGNPLRRLRRQGARPALAERHHQEAPERVSRAGRRARPEVALPGREPELPDPRRRDRPRLERVAGGRDRHPLDARLRRGDRRRRHAVARLGRLQGVLLQLGQLPRLVPRDPRCVLGEREAVPDGGGDHPPCGAPPRGASQPPRPRLLPDPRARDRLRGPLPGLPTILVIFMLGFGMPALGLGWIPDSQFFWAVVALSLVYTAYVSEVYRAGIESVHPRRRPPPARSGSRSSSRFATSSSLRPYAA